jgi:hypothetical protein
MVIGPRRIVPHVLAMTAFKFSDPIQIFVQMKSDDFPWFTLKLSLWFHCTLLAARKPRPAGG